MYRALTPNQFAFDQGPILVSLERDAFSTLHTEGFLRMEKMSFSIVKYLAIFVESMAEPESPAPTFTSLFKTKEAQITH